MLRLCEYSNGTTNFVPVRQYIPAHLQQHLPKQFLDLAVVVFRRCWVGRRSRSGPGGSVKGVRRECQGRLHWRTPTSWCVHTSPFSTRFATSSHADRSSRPTSTSWDNCSSSRPLSNWTHAAHSNSHATTSWNSSPAGNLTTPLPRSTPWILREIDVVRPRVISQLLCRLADAVKITNNSGPCNSCYCLRHLKNVYDGDDDIEKLWFLPDEKAALGYCVNYDQSLIIILTGSKYRHCTQGRIIQ